MCATIYERSFLIMEFLLRVSYEGGLLWSTLCTQFYKPWQDDWSIWFLLLQVNKRRGLNVEKTSRTMSISFLPQSSILDKEAMIFHSLDASKYKLNHIKRISFK